MAGLRSLKVVEGIEMGRLGIYLRDFGVLADLWGWMIRVWACRALYGMLLSLFTQANILTHGPK